MSHANARLTPHGRLLLARRVIEDHRPVAHVAKELGVSRQCAHRWVNRYRTEGAVGLVDRCSRPHTQPTRTDTATEVRVLTARTELRAGPDVISDATGVPPRTITRILHRHHRPPLVALDPLTGEQIRATRRSEHRYEHTKPGSLVHVDVKKLGRIPAGGGWRAHGRSEEVRGRGIGFDYVHACIDDHSRYAYAEILPDERAQTCADFFTRAAAAFAAAGITRIQRVMTDNALVYRKSLAFRAAVAAVGARQKFIRPHCPWTNGKVERFNRTLGIEWAYRQVFTSNDARAEALAPWLVRYNTTRPHHALGRQAPITRLPVTNVPAEYS